MKMLMNNGWYGVLPVRPQRKGFGFACKARGFQGGVTPWSQGEAQAEPEKWRQRAARNSWRALEGGTRSGSPSKDPRVGWVERGRTGSTPHQDPSFFIIITEKKMLPYSFFLLTKGRGGIINIIR